MSQLPQEQAGPAAIPAGIRQRMSRRTLFRAGSVAIGVGVVLLAIWLFSGPENGELSLKLYNRQTVMTVAYKAYGNPEAAHGKYWLAKSVIENTGRGSLKNVRISYQIPDYISWTTPDEAPEILPGQTAVFSYYPKLPSKVTQIHSKTPASLEVKIDYTDASGTQTKIEKREFEFRGVTEMEWTSLPQDEIVTWYDVFDNAELLAAWVQDEDPAVKAYYAKISEVSGGIGVMQTGKDLQQLANSVYNFMVSTGMTYSGTKGVPEKIGDVKAIIQSIRLPRDVIYGNSGLCVELTLLWCSVAQTAGAKAYLVLLPGHAFAVLQADDGTRIPIECTAIGGGAGGNLGAAGTFEQAVDSAAKTLQDLNEKGTPYEMLDLAEFQSEGIRPPELPDINRTELTSLLDDLRARHGGGAARSVRALPANAGANANAVPKPSPTVTPSPESGNLVTWRDPNGLITLSYPAGWRINPQTVAAIRQMLPGYLFAASDPVTQAGVEAAVYYGASNPQAVVQQINMVIRGFGSSASYGPPQQITLGGLPCTTFAATLMTPQGPVQSAINIVRIGNMWVSVDVSAPQAAVPLAAHAFSQILSNVRFGR